MHRCLGCMTQYKDEYNMCPYCGYERDSKPAEAYHIIPGTLLASRYIVGRALGFGGFGVTYIGYDCTLDRKVAIKEYLPSDFSTRVPGQIDVTAYEGERTEQFESGMNKFLNEAQMLAKMQETNGVVQIYNSFKENRTAYIIMEYLEGKTLKAYLDERGKISVAEAKAILHPTIEALKDVHEMGIIHRDIAPDNIFLTNDGRVKLLDFGASRFATTSHSKSLSVILKPGYASVEQYRSRGDQGPWTDVYSLAATLYKAITGIIPEDAMERVEREDLKKPSKLGVEISKSEENALMNALNIKVEDRTRDVAQFEEELYRSDRVKLHRSKIKKGDVGKWPLWTKLTISVACLAIVLFGGALATGLIDYSYIVPKGIPLPEGMTRVPNVVNEDVLQAEIMTTDAQMIFQIVDKQYSEFIPRDMVLSQSVDKGKIVNVDNVLEVIVSGGKQSYSLQDVTGMSQAEAMAYLVNLGMDIEIEQEYSAVQAGDIVSQSLEAGALVQKGDKIVLVVSLGLNSYLDESVEVEVPNLSGLSFEKAQEEAQKMGIYLVKAGTKESNKPLNTILEQTPSAGTKVKQGESIKIVVAGAKLVYYMPDVQYKDEAVAIADLKAVGVTANVTYEESKTIAKGKVISQSIAANTEVKSGQIVTLIVSGGSKEIVVHEWSVWADSLPEGIDKNRYEIDTKVQYLYRNKSFTDGYKEMPGWTLYKTVTEKGEFGSWSDWSTNAPVADSNREIEQKTQYSYSDYESTQKTDDANAPGDDWTLKSQDGYYLDDYGTWSEWTTDPASESDSVQVEKKTQWRANKRTWVTKTDDSNPPNGYTLDGSKTQTSYGNWTDYVEGTSPTQTATLEVQSETRTRQVQTGTKYKYFKWYNPETKFYSYKQSYAGAAAKYYSHESTTLYSVGKTFTDPNPPYTKWDAYDINGKGDYYFLESSSPIYTDQYYNVYKTRTKTTTYYFYSWSGLQEWQDSEIASDNDTEVESRTVYRYRTRPIHYTYTFERWSPYTAFSDDSVAETSTRKVKTQTIYRYRDKTDLSHYYYYIWGNWSDYSDEKIDASENREVQTKILYRYREKN